MWPGITIMSQYIVAVQQEKQTVGCLAKLQILRQDDYYLNFHHIASLCFSQLFFHRADCTKKGVPAWDQTY